MPYDPTLGAQAQPQAVNPNATPEEKMAYEAGWSDYLQRPEVRASLLQFGIQAMQPVPIQQSGAGAFANAIGSGAQAYDRNVTAQGEAAQQDVKNALAQDELASRNRQVTATETGNRLQYDLGMAGLRSKETIASNALKGKQRVAEIMADSRVDAATKSALAQYSIYNPDATQEQVDQFRAQIEARDAGVGPATGGPATGTAPAIPENLKGKNPGWNPRAQRWQLPDGTNYNQQGVPVS